MLNEQFCLFLKSQKRQQEAEKIYLNKCRYILDYLSHIFGQKLEYNANLLIIIQVIYKLSQKIKMSGLCTPSREQNQSPQAIEEKCWQYYKKGIEKIFEGNRVLPGNAQSQTRIRQLSTKEERQKNELCSRNSREIKRFILLNINSPYFGLDELKGLSLTEWINLHTLVINSSLFLRECLSNLKKAKWNKLQRISLQNNQLNRSHMEALKQFVENWESLNQLNLSNNQIELEVDSISLLENVCKKLQILYLNNNKINNRSLKHLVCSKVQMFQWSKLKLLSLKNNNIGQKGIRYLASNDKLYKNLQRLILTGNKIGNKGVQNVSKINFPCLEQLFIQDCGLIDDSILILQEMKLKNIICLSFDKNSISQLNKMNLISQLELNKNSKAKIMVELKYLLRQKYKICL